MEIKLKELNKTKRAVSRESNREAVLGAMEKGIDAGEKSTVHDNGIATVSDSQILETVDSIERHLVEATVAVEQQIGNVTTPENKNRSEVINDDIEKLGVEVEDQSDVSLVFGPGASKLKLREDSVPSNFSPVAGASTPLRQRSRGRRRFRNSGRSLPSSPSPVRPPSQKLKLDEEGPGTSVERDELLKEKDLLDPGDPKGDDDLKYDDGKTTHEMSDSGDWGDTTGEVGLDEQKSEKINNNLKVGTSKEDSETIQSDQGTPLLVVQDLPPSVDQDSGS